MRIRLALELRVERDRPEPEPQKAGAEALVELAGPAEPFRPIGFVPAYEGPR